MGIITCRYLFTGVHSGSELRLRLGRAILDRVGIFANASRIRRYAYVESVSLPVHQLLRFNILRCISEGKVCRISQEVQSDSRIQV